MKPFFIARRLAGAFSVLAAVLVVVGWQGISQLHQLNEQMQNIVCDRWEEQQMSHQAYNLSSQNGQITLLIFLTEDPNAITRLLAQRAANTQRITELVNTIGPRLDTDRERELFADVNAKRAPYIENYQRALSLLLSEHKPDEARKMMVDVVQPGLIAYHDSWGAFNQYEAVEIDQAMRQSKTEFASDQQNFLLLLALAGLITGAIAIFTVSRMYREIVVRQQTEQSLLQAHDQLEQRILERTAELVNADERVRLLNSAVLQSKEAILITDANLDLPGPTIIFVNPAFTQMTGYTPEETIGKTPRMLQGPLTDRAVLGRLRQNLDQGEMFAGEAINYRRDGTPFDLEWQIAPLRDADEKITHFVAIQRDITERKRSAARFRRLTDSDVQGVVFWNLKGEIIGANNAFLKLVGYTRKDLEAGRINWVEMTPPEYAHLDRNAIKEIAAAGFCTLYEKEFIRKDGSRVPVLLGSADFEDSPDEGVCFVLDLTDRKRLEAQLFQSQKMETVGKLTGGIAHEFNSILTAIIGQSEFLLDDLPPGSPSALRAIEINNAADRAANLTRQLLAYGRKQTLQPKILDLNFVLAGMEDSLRLLMGRETEVCLTPAVGLKSVKVDAGQMEQVVLNMAINASDAMPHGGKLTLETTNVSLDEDDVRLFPDSKIGDYVMLAITDTGTGMSPETLARIFEPFFTTKGIGQGSGLGLSTSHGIIQQSGGHISVQSTPTLGTTFKIYLPQIDRPAKPSSTSLDSPNLPRGTETILLVENNPALRELSVTLLELLGYTVLAAATGGEALSQARQRNPDHVDLLFADSVMPDMDAPELSGGIQALYPQIKILFACAPNEQAHFRSTGPKETGAFLHKPVSPFALAHKLREMLDQPAAASSGTG